MKKPTCFLYPIIVENDATLTSSELIQIRANIDKPL